MTQFLQSPRNLSPMWLDLAHVIANEPTRLIVHPGPDAAGSRRTAVPGDWSAPRTPHAPRRRLSMPVVLLAQVGGAVLTAGLLLMMGLGPT